MKRLSFLLVLLSSFVCIKAQESIKGKVVDEKNAPLEYANIVLLSQKDSIFIAGTISDAQGDFSLKSPLGNINYLIKISSIGYEAICRLVQVGNIGPFILKSDAQMLGEIVVKGDLPVTRLKNDALVTNVEGSVLAKAGTARNLLAYIPAVTAQGGELNVFGRGAPIVYINGRQMRDNSELDQLSSDNIKSVEVVTNPGARYAASVKAVIRINTKKTIGEGFGFSNRVSGEYNREWSYLDQLNLNYRKGGLDIFGMLYYSDNYWWRNFNAIQDTYLDKHWRQTLYSREENRAQNIVGNIGLNYVFNPNHSVGFRYQLNRKPDTDVKGFMDADITQDDSSFEYTQSGFSSFSQSVQHSVNMYYNGSIGKWNVDFNTDVLWTENNEKTLTKEQITPAGGEVIKQNVNTSNDIENKLYASKLVFSHQLLGGSFSLGGEYSYTNRHNDYRNPEGILYNDASEIEEGNMAIFTEYSRGFGKTSLQLGLRYENISFDYFQSGIRQGEQSKDYNNLFPSISVSTSVGKIQIQLGYTQDITRPSFRSLRSAITYNNHYLYETGNPLLRPSLTHNITLVGSYKWWQLYAGYQRVEDNMIRVIEPYSDDDPTIALMKLVNSHAYDKMFMMLSASPTIGIWSPRFTLGMQKQWYKVESPDGDIRLNRPIISCKWQNSLRLPAGFLLSIGGAWYSKYDAENYSLESEWGVDAGLYKGFMKERLSFQVQAYDLFQTNHSRYMYYYGKFYTMSQDIEPNGRSVNLTVKYKFNQARDKYKGSGAGKSQKNRL